jgi:hypothetical protein
LVRYNQTKTQKGADHDKRTGPREWGRYKYTEEIIMSKAEKPVAKEAERNIKVQVGDVANARDAMIWLGEQTLPIDQVLPFIRSRRIANTLIGDYNDARNSIIRRYANGGDKVTNDSPAIAEINALLFKNVEVPDPGITWEMVKDFKWTANQLDALSWLIHDIPL